ncbi:sugar ABC transporter ATP-binding protein [Aquibacillus koreensis]|uniref:Sugar ABC transporter ATP-binding protein n=1 Tax=Aquibacillus koreensis TaxID=279446 RepID=A0A9X3WRV5_9BACI|nr:sugar ABC transporter ATP-binding protein [Aquibacillus koreensis]MCT2535429.1 sugar ABC transporter ATP-binding protein [Aquibacillus koreensis]MDC3422264.1 sugar ABC transporter ATP-binding protein [Aquibacillus koreensis]
MEHETILEMIGVKKSFHNNEVLHGVDLVLNKGEIHALLGENGAGKSTLMNILGGVHQPDNGQIKITGQTVLMGNPRISQAHGVSFIHQELNVVTDLTVYENMFLGSELRTKIGFLDEKEMCRQTREVLSKLGVHIDPKTYVRDLETSYKQMIEIAKALLSNSKIIIMDEPTTSLTDNEVERLFTIMRSLKQSGVSIIYISHKLKEIQAVCDRYTVLRDGNLVGTGNMKDTDLSAITQLMVGKSVSTDAFYNKATKGEPVLTVKNLTSEGLFKDVNFSLSKGEVLGFTGLAGDGRTELFESIFGFRKKYGGVIEVSGKPVKINHPKQALRAGIGLVPKNRKENAIIKDLSVIENMSLTSMGHFEKNGFISSKTEQKRFQEYKEQLNIKVHDPKVTIDSLSGGNQQKVVIAKWLEVNGDIIIFDNPTQGIDVGAKNEIYQHIMHLAEMGKAIIILSSEAPEILRVCDRVNIMFHGEITGKFTRDELTEEKIMEYATGSKREAKNIG